MKLSYNQKNNTMVYHLPLFAGWSIPLTMKQGGFLYKVKFYAQYPKFIMPAIKRGLSK